MESKSFSKEIIEWIKSILFAVVIAFFIKSFIFNTTFVQGMSMYPTLMERDRLFSNKIPLYFRGPNRGDVVILKSPMGDGKDYIKRVVAIEGDRLEIRDGLVYLNGEVLEEPYIEEGIYTHTGNTNTWYIGEGQVFVLGDNRNVDASIDSRYFGPIDIKTLKGITSFRYFPFKDRFGKID